jgi:hypothetical protein
VTPGIHASVFCSAAADPGLLVLQSLELLHDPSEEMLIDARRKGVQLGAV